MEAELDATVDLSILRGTFEGWDFTKEYHENPKMDYKEVLEGNNSFYSYLLWDFYDQTKRMQKYGRRNLSWSTCAPTGTTSLMTQTTSGIEPLIKPYYKRRVKVMGTDKEYDFKSNDGQFFKEYFVAHPKLKEFIKPYGIEDTSKFKEGDWKYWYERSPYYKCCANDISWKDRVDIQSIIQKYVSHSISSTLNLPKETTVEQISEIYMEAYKQGLKGVTVYVEGSRDGVLVDANTINTGIKINSAPKRPKVLPASLCIIKSGGITYAVIVGLLNGRPFEVFAYANPDTKCNTLGQIIKVSKGKYRFESKDYVCENLQLANDKIEEKACTLYASMLLRHGADIKFIIKTTRKVNANISSFSAAMCRVLSQYIPKEIIKGEVCPECHQPLVHEGGCVHCSSCTYSRCLIMIKKKK